MRKYILGIIAVAVAISLNAFTTKKQAPVKPVGNELIWYLVSSGQINPSNPINAGDPMDDAELRSTYSVCPGSGAACARGFFPNALPTSGTDQGAEAIQKTP